MTWPAPLDHVYILCDPEKEPDRAKYLHGWLSEQKIDPKTYTLISKCYGTSLKAEDAIKAYNPFQNRKPIEFERNFSSHNLKISEVSLLINWHDSATTAVNAGHRYVMMLESDVIFTPTFLTDLKTALGRAPPFDFLSISAVPFLRPKRAAGDTELKWFKPMNYHKTRTTDAMIFAVPMLEKISKTFFPCTDVLDWELNYQLNLHSARCGWLDPPIISQGSGNGTYESSLF